MTESDDTQLATRKRPKVLYLVLAAILAVPAGLGLSIFGVIGWAACVIVLLFGLTGRLLRQGWAIWTLWIGMGLVLGAVLYLSMGTSMRGAEPCGGGSGVSQQQLEQGFRAAIVTHNNFVPDFRGEAPASKQTRACG